MQTTPSILRTSLLAAVLFAAALPARAQEPQPALPFGGVLLDSYAAIANGAVVTVGDVMSAIQADPPSPFPTDPAKLTELYRKTRDTLVATELIQQEFTALGATLPERAIEDHVASVVHDRFHGNRTALLEALAAERLTYEEWRQRMLRQLIVQLMRQREVDAKIAVTPVDIQAEYEARAADYDLPERVRLEVWSMPAPDPAIAAQVEAARAYYREFLRSTRAAPPETPAWPDVPSAPANFAPRREELLGEWLPASELAPAFADALSKVSPVGAPRPLRMGNRTYFLRLLDREPARRQSLEEAAPAIAAKLRAAERARLEAIWLDSLRSKYHVQYYEHDLFDDPFYGASR
jgi:peptidyl-prolyl cis-trans isomerase SurA